MAYIYRREPWYLPRKQVLAHSDRFFSPSAATSYRRVLTREGQLAWHSALGKIDILPPIARIPSLTSKHPKPRSRTLGARPL